MAIYRSGARGSEIRLLQRILIDNGFDPGPVDGIFGPLTEQAVKAYQGSKGWATTGTVDTKMLTALGIDSPGGGDEPSDYTDDELTRFIGLPGEPEIWKNSDTGVFYVVYFAPGQEPPIPLLFTVKSKDQLDSFFGTRSVRADHTFTTDQFNSVGAVEFGSTDTIPATEGDVFAGFTERMNRARESMPWLNDPEVFAVYAGAWIEGRNAPERWELEATDYWQTRNEAQREWIWLTARDPEEAKKLKEANAIIVHDQLQQMGLDDINESLVDFLTNEFTVGNWSSQYLQTQVRAIAGADVGMDRGLKRYIKQNEIVIDRSDSEGEQIRQLFNEWLGPNHPPNERQIARWSRQFRTNKEEAIADLTARLRAQRKALFPQYEDENLTYDDIASPWRGFMAQHWGKTVDETDPTFQRLIKLNDAEEGAKYLRKQGIKRGNRTIQMDLLRGLQSVSSGVRPPV